MRKSTLAIATGLASYALAMAAPAAEPLIIGTAPIWEQLQYQDLGDQAALDNLQHTNPRHYAIARRILAAAGEICGAGQRELIPAKFDVDTISCSGALWLASLPPKKSLSFRIDNTVYSALIAVTETRAKVLPAH